MTEENNETLVLDIEEIVNSAMNLHLKTKDGIKKLKIYSLTTLTALEAESCSRDNLKLLKRLDSVREEIKEAKGDKKKKLVREQSEVIGNLEQGLADQIYIILHQDNPDITKQEIVRWGIPKCFEFVNWFNNPRDFLEKAQDQEEPTKKEAKETQDI